MTIYKLENKCSYTSVCVRVYVWTSVCVCTCVCLDVCVCTYESILLQISQVSQCLQVSLVSVVPPVELDTVQPVHLHTGHGALQRCLHHLHTGTTLFTGHGSPDSCLEAQDSMSKHRHSFEEGLAKRHMQLQ